MRNIWGEKDWQHKEDLKILKRVDKVAKNKTEENKKLRQVVCDIAHIFPKDGTTRQLIIEMLEKQELDKHLIKRVLK